MSEMPVRAGLLGAFVILVVVGLFRAIAEFGHAGLIAWAKLLLGPSGIALVAVVLLPGSVKDKGLRAAFPSDDTLRIILMVVVAVTGLALLLAALFGVGGIVAR